MSCLYCGGDSCGSSAGGPSMCENSDPLPVTKIRICEQAGCKLPATHTCWELDGTEHRLCAYHGGRKVAAMRRAETGR